MDSIPLIDEQVKHIEYTASDEYRLNQLKLRKLFKDEYDKLEFERVNFQSKKAEYCRLAIESIEKTIIKHFELKDRILEEVDEEYKNRIDYDKIYTIENVYPGVINKIYYMYNLGFFKKIYVLSHVNCEREINAKRKFLNKYLPMVEFVPVYFHMVPFYVPGTKIRNEKRFRTNKIEYFKKEKNIENLDNYFFVDDNETIIEEAKEAGVGCCELKDNSKKTTNILDRFIETIIEKSIDGESKVLRK